MDSDRIDRPSSTFSSLPGRVHARTVFGGGTLHERGGGGGGGGRPLDRDPAGLGAGTGRPLTLCEI